MSSTYKFQIPGSEKGISFKVEKRGLASRLIRGLLASVLVLTFVGNVLFILAAVAEMRGRSSDEDRDILWTRGRGSHPELPGSAQDEGERYHVKCCTRKNGRDWRIVKCIFNLIKA
jgi:hypothetical protein